MASPTRDPWNGKTDLVLLAAWIARERGTLSSYHDAVRRLQASEQGMPAPWIERLIAPVFA